MPRRNVASAIRYRSVRRRNRGTAKQAERRNRELIGAATSSTSYDPPEILDVPRMFISRQKPYTFATTTELTPISQSMSADTVGQYVFTPSMLTNYSQIGALFTQIRVLQVDLHFLPTPLANAGNLVTAISYTTEVPASISDVLQYPTSQSNPILSSFHRVINPRAQILGAETIPSSASGSPRWGVWFDSALGDWSLYGLVFGLDQGAASVVAWNVRATFVLQARNIF